MVSVETSYSGNIARGGTPGHLPQAGPASTGLVGCYRTCWTCWHFKKKDSPSPDSPLFLLKKIKETQCPMRVEFNETAQFLFEERHQAQKGAMNPLQILRGSLLLEL